MEIEKEIAGRIDNLIQSNAKTMPCHTNRASELGHPCLRFLFYTRTAWDKRQRPVLDALYRMREGIEQEKIVIRQLMDAGFEIREQQTAKAWKTFQLTGHFDGKISLNGSRPVIMEIKSMSRFTFDKIEKAVDLKKEWWHQKWLAQMQLYMLLENEEYGLFILKNRDTGKINVIPVELDLEYAETLLKKAEVVNKAITGNKPPDYIKENPELCQRCDFLSVCAPPIEIKDVKVLDNEEEIVRLIDRKLELDPLIKEHSEIKKSISKASEDEPCLLCGKYQITGKWIERKSFTVPESKYWKSRIVQIL